MAAKYTVLTAHGPTPLLSRWGATAGGTNEVRGKRPPPSPELRDALLPLATVCAADLGATTRAVACVSPGMQQGVLNFGVEASGGVAGARGQGWVGG